MERRGREIRKRPKWTKVQKALKRPERYESGIDGRKIQKGWKRLDKMPFLEEVDERRIPLRFSEETWGKKEEFPTAGHQRIQTDTLLRRLARAGGPGD